MIRRTIAALGLLIFCVLAPSQAQAASPGINLTGALGDTTLVQKALDTGAAEVRIFVDWSSMEPGSAADFTFDPATGINDNNMARGTLQAIAQIKNAGRRVTVVMTNSPQWASGQADPHYPPTNVDDYAKFAAEFSAAAKAQGTPISNLEVWNEPEGGEFWKPGPDPAKYTQLLQAAYTAIKTASPETAVFAGPTTGNNYNWIQSLYANGVKGSFDGVAVHTDTACLVNGPDSFYKENGRLAQFTFLGYREVRQTMLANGDDKPIAMSEVGWSATNGNSTSCGRGLFAGKKASGVSQAEQAQYLTKAFGCMANDPYVIYADWFTLNDSTGGPLDELNHYGLYDTSGKAKPSLAAFKAVAAANGGGPVSCGDFDAPTIKVQSPSANQQFVDKLDLSASASDNGGVGLGRISFFVDDQPAEIRNFTGDALKENAPVGLAPWQGSGKLALGPHMIKVVALDMNGNQSQVLVPVTKVATMASTLTPKFKLAKKVSCKKRNCTLKGSLSRVIGGRPSIGGKVAVAWEFRNKKGKWRKLVGGLKPASKAFSFTLKAKFKGAWRVRVTYAGQSPYKKATSKTLTFKVK